MRMIWIASMVGLLAVPAFAQKAPPGPPPPPPKTRMEIEADRAAANAYQKSLHAIPDKPPADPWGGARSMDTPKAGTGSAKSGDPKK